MNSQIRSTGQASVKLKFRPGVVGPKGAKGDTGNIDNGAIITALAVAEDRKLGAWLGQIGRPLSRKIAVVGDSRSSSAGNSNTRYNLSWQHWLGVVTRQRVDMDPTLNFSFSGAKSEHILNPQLPSALASQAGAVICYVGVNDRDVMTADQTIANLASARDQVIAAGKIFILVAETPKGSPSFPGARMASPQLQYHFRVHQWCLEQQGKPGVYVADPWASLALASSTTGDNIDTVTYDGLHPNVYGNYLIAKALQPIVEALYTPLSILPASNSDAYSAQYNPTGVLNPNPMALGTTGGKFGGTTGSVADNWFVSGTFTGATVAADKYTDADGIEWQRVTIGGTPSVANPVVEIRSTQTVFPAGDDVLEAVGEIWVDGAASGYYGAYLYAQSLGTTTKFASDGSTGFNRDGLAFTSGGVYRTPRFTAPATPTQGHVSTMIFLKQSVAASVVVRCRALAVRKVG